MKVLLEKRPSSQRTVMLRLLRLVYPDVKGLAGGDWWLCHKLWAENQAGNKHEQKCKVQCWGKVAFSSNVPRELCWLKSKLASGFWSEWKRNQVLCLQHEIVLQCDTSATYGTAVLHLNLDSHQFAAFWVAVYHICSQAEQFAYLRCAPSFCLYTKCCCPAASAACFYCLFQNAGKLIIFLKIFGGLGCLTSYFFNMLSIMIVFSPVSYFICLHATWERQICCKIFHSKTNCMSIMSCEGSFFIALIFFFLISRLKKPLIILFLGIICFRIKDGGNCYLWQLKDNITGSWGCQSHNQGCLVRGTKLLPLGKPKQIGSSWKKWVKPGGKKEVSY